MWVTALNVIPKEFGNCKNIIIRLIKGYYSWNTSPADIRSRLTMRNASQRCDYLNELMNTDI